MTRVVTLGTNRNHYDIWKAADESMTVRELIEELRCSFDPDSKIVFKNDNGFTYGNLCKWMLSEERLAPEEEEELDLVVTREEMVEEIKKKVDSTPDRDIHTFDFIDIEFPDGDWHRAIAVGFHEMEGKYMVATGDFCGIFLDDLTDDGVEDIWRDICR